MKKCFLSTYYHPSCMVCLVGAASLLSGLELVMVQLYVQSIYNNCAIQNIEISSIISWLIELMDETSK